MFMSRLDEFDLIMKFGYDQKGNDRDERHLDVHLSSTFNWGKKNRVVVVSPYNGRIL